MLVDAGSRRLFEGIGQVINIGKHICFGHRHLAGGVDLALRINDNQSDQDRIERANNREKKATNFMTGFQLLSGKSFANDK